jgi:transitional endoplasmic reticulum ATPase
VIFVPPPDATARREILRVLLSGKPVAEMDVDIVARKTEEYSGADLKALVDVAVEAKLREAIRAGRPKPITTRDLLGAIQSSRPTTREWFASARNHALYANQGGIYDEILQYLKIK